MRRWAGLSLIVVLCGGLAGALGHAFAQLPWGHPAGVTVTPSCSSSYVGPGDLASGAVGWWGLRAFSNAIAVSQPIIASIVRQSDNAQQALHVTCAGDIDVATAVHFCAGTNCRWCNLSDQTGVTGPAGAGLCSSYNNNQTLTFNCLNGSLPCVTGVPGSNSFNTTGGHPPTTAQPISASAVAERTGSFTTAQSIVSNFSNFFNPNAPSLFFSSSANTVTWSSPTAQTASASDSTWHAFQAVFNGASGVINVDGTETSGSTGTGGLSTNDGVGIGGKDTNDLTAGQFVEAGFWGAGFTGTQRTNICHNQISYWGISGSC